MRPSILLWDHLEDSWRAERERLLSTKLRSSVEACFHTESQVKIKKMGRNAVLMESFSSVG